ncbi:MAG: alpha/beta hydrolase fold domain-containing protein [Aristaeellaceae bacterium]
MERNIPPMGGPGVPPPDFRPPMADISGIRRKTLDIPYAGESPSQRLDLFLPDAGDGPFPALVYIHGGGFAIGDKRDDHLQPYLKALERGWAVAAVEYRLSGEAIFPAAVLDVRKAVRFLRTHAAAYGLDPDRLIAIGGSAGGNLAAMLGMNIPNGAFPGESTEVAYAAEPFVIGAVDQFGPIAFKTMDDQARANAVSIVEHDLPHSAESRYLGIPIAQACQPLCDQASPLTYAGGQMAPLLVQHGTMDRLVPCQQSEEFVKALQAKGLGGKVRFVPLEGADHEDKRFFSDENLRLVFDFIESILKEC